MGLRLEPIAGTARRKGRLGSWGPVRRSSFPAERSAPLSAALLLFRSSFPAKVAAAAGSRAGLLWQSGRKAAVGTRRAAGMGQRMNPTSGRGWSERRGFFPSKATPAPPLSARGRRQRTQRAQPKAAATGRQPATPHPHPHPDKGGGVLMRPDVPSRTGAFSQLGRPRGLLLEGPRPLPLPSLNCNGSRSGQRGPPSHTWSLGAGRERQRRGRSVIAWLGCSGPAARRSGADFRGCRLT